MTIAYPIPKWDRPTPTTYPLNYADLTELPLDLFDSPSGREELVRRVKHALEEDDLGFWSVTNTGFSEEEIEHQFAIGQAFYNLPLEERQSNPIDAKNGGYLGYRAAYERTINGTDVLDNMELLNIPKYTKHFASTPRHDIIKAHEAAISDFHRRCWTDVARKLFVLFALAMELPENYFVDRHAYDEPSQDHLRYMMYHPRSEEDDAKCNNLWSWAHTDYGSLTLLFSQTVSGLQVKFADGTYHDIKPKTGSIVVNVADTLSFMTKGYLRSTIHRVTRPPPDQAHIHRIGVLYGCRPNDSVPVVVAPSPLLERLGLITDADRIDEKDAVTAGEYVAARVKAVHASTTYGYAPGTKFKHGNLEVLENFADVKDGASTSI
ncbi:hypothetical protein L202_07869 [Cryptococcus amylolentus CBS 6039]|uniref:Fe2OG dioxygenase domain-containing protein n=2 Tax=Cryptococcus amylolentus TaxID=104669 RepID=A0A1E3HAF4_9TREE|nr:hypothetical protein L202_07869 [Cryptococcus amylolentus CBS 6039]ODN73327.1 hypothetical protein L202_07869 [Cryptococcus amylolentus CBS 6039]ODN99123.1 hypothetical protein I350_07278 [Cryptococcus amylolentus CBS 6273]